MVLCFYCRFGNDRFEENGVILFITVLISPHSTACDFQLTENIKSAEGHDMEL